MRYVLIVLEDFPASENRVQRQARALIECGHDVVVYAATGADSRSEWAGARIVRSHVVRRKAGSMPRRLMEYVGFSITMLFWLTGHVMRSRPSVIQVASMPDWLAAVAAPAAWLSGARLVLDMHELMPELFDTKGSSRLLRFFLLLQEAIGVKAADRVLVPTEMCAERLVSRRVGLQPVVIVNGVDTGVFPIATPVRRSRRELRIGYVGTLADRWGVHTVIEALGMLIQHGDTETTLDVIGDGEARRALEDLSSRLGLHEQVRFLGQQPADRVAELMADIDLGVVPYIDTDYARLAYPTKAFEYAIRGCPMLCSDLPSIRRLFDEEMTLYARPEDPEEWARQIATARDEPERVHVMACRAQKIVASSYTWAVWRERYVSSVGATDL